MAARDFCLYSPLFVMGNREINGVCAVIFCTLLWELHFFLALGQPGFISIDCGSPVESYTDTQTGITYISDSGYIKYGKNWTLSSTYTERMPKNLETLRSFPEGNKTCYVLQPVNPGDRYLIRASFLYGDYDGLNSFPKFDLYLGVTFVQTISGSVSEWLQYEFIVMPTTKSVSVCLLRTTKLGIPFISALELRPITGNTIYNVVTGTLALQTLSRWSCGANTSHRYPDDMFDRFWIPVANTELDILTTSSDISMTADPYLPPTAVMQIAEACPPDVCSGIYLEPTIPSSDASVFLCLHFVELESLSSTDVREMEITMNDKHWYGPFTPLYLQATYVCSNGTFQPGGIMQILWIPTGRSTLPVTVSAMDAYIAIQLSSFHTDDGDAAAVDDIRDNYDINKRWTGDPCLPRGYGWESLTCSNDTSPRIKSLSLSSSDLSGPIHKAFGDLGALSSLDLADNELTGKIPDSLGDLTDLAELDLSDNDLSGDVPESLIRKWESGRLKLNISGNPKLCASEACRKKKKDWTVIIGSCVPAALIFIYLLIACPIILLRIKKRNAAHTRNPPGNLANAHVGHESTKGRGEMRNKPSSSYEMASADNFPARH